MSDVDEASASYAELDGGLIGTEGLRPELPPLVAREALAWLEAGVDPAVVELASELVARLASHLGTDTADAAALETALVHLAPPPQLVALVRAAAPRPLVALEVAALAVVLVDISERAALEVFVPELPALTAKSDRSGDAARRVGAARHLRG